jgi:hypothetical protein
MLVIILLYCCIPVIYSFFPPFRPPHSPADLSKLVLRSQGKHDEEVDEKDEEPR